MCAAKKSRIKKGAGRVLLPFTKDASASVFVSHVDSVSLVQLSWYLGSMIASARLPPQPIWRTIQVEAAAPRHGSVRLPTAAASCSDGRCSYIRVCSSPQSPFFSLLLLLLLLEEGGGGVGRGGRAGWRWSHRQQLISTHQTHVRHGGVKWLGVVISASLSSSVADNTRNFVAFITLWCDKD